MKHALNALAFFLLTNGAVCAAAADPAPQPISVHASGLREQMRALRFEQQAMEQQEHRSSQAQASEHRADDGNADTASSQSSGSGTDEASRNGRMSPEERRALRQQIDEAGHEIYAPSH